MSTYYIYGRNPVRECLRAGSIITLYTRKRLVNDALVKEIAAAGIPVVYKEDPELQRISGESKHQGFVALATAPEMISLHALLQRVRGKESPLIVILDGIADPVNLGTILRSCDAFGVDGIIVKNTGGVTLNATVAKVSTGAVAYVPVCGVANLSQAISELKDARFWVVASDGSATKNYDEIDYHGPIALIVGSEGFGVSRLVLERSDFVVKIPMVGHVNSLNASVATGILLAQILRARN